MPVTNTTPFTEGPPSPSYRPCTRSRMFCLLAPIPTRTAEESSLRAHASPAATSKPAAAIRLRASTPAAYQVLPVLETHADHAVTFTSASAWKLGPSARIGPAEPPRICVLSDVSGGTLTRYCAHG